MPLDTTLVKLLILLLPGLTGRIVYYRLKANRLTTLWKAILDVFLFAFVSYVIAGFFSSTADGGQPISNNLTAILQDTDNIDWIELYRAVGISFIVGLCAAYVHNHKLINRFGRFLKITHSFGDEDVWEYIYNSPDVEWIYLRDHVQNLTYYGRVTSYSDSHQPREVVLSNVIAYDNLSGEQLYELDGVYVARDNGAMTIEIPLYSSHVPERLTKKQYESLMQAAGKKEKKLLRKVYGYAGLADDYYREPDAKVRNRRQLQELLNREKLSIIHIRGESGVSTESK
ncbi:MAG: DUF6338 family protein [Alkalispirochaeta sp.]